jgi:PKD repeat protein
MLLPPYSGVASKMLARWWEEWLLASVVLVAIVAGSGAAVYVISDGAQAQTAACTADPTTVQPGETVTLDASGSDANFVEFDVDGDGEYEEVDETDFIVNVTYTESGTYEPIARADGADTDPCGTVTVNEPPSAALTVSPNPATTGEAVTFNASGSADPDGRIVEYRWDFDGDGVVDETTNDSQVQHTYSEADVYVPSVTVVDDDGATGFAERDIRVAASVVAACTVEPASVPPGETVTIDATDSENAEMIDYDVDGDGEYEVVEETAFTLEWPYEVEGEYTPRVRVYDGEQEDTADCGSVTVEEPNEPPIPALSMSPRPGTTGQQITFDASASVDPDGRIVEYQWDFDGDGIIDNRTRDPVTTHTFDQVDVYVPRVTVVDDDGASRSTQDELPIREGTTPTRELRCTVEPTSVTPGEEVRIDARESTGVTSIDYDVDGDGEFERPGRTELATTVVYEEAGSYGPRVRVNGSDDIEECGIITVGGGDDSSPGSPIVPAWVCGLLPIPCWTVPLLLFGVGIGGGLLLCRRLRTPRIPTGFPGGAGSEGGIIGYATGTIETPRSSEMLAVTGVGFEPDLVLFTATNNVTAGERSTPGQHRTDGWNYGAVRRTDDGSLEQHVLSVANDFQRTDAAIGSARTGRVLDIIVHEDEQANGLVATVTETTSDGFDLEFDASALPDERADDSYVVLYKAFEFESPDDIAIGHFTTPTEEGHQTLDLDIDADHVVLTATNGLEGMDDVSETGDAVGISHGNVVGRTRLSQTVQNSTIDPSRATRNAYAAHDDHALSMLHVEDGAVQGETRGRVTNLGAELEFEYEMTHAPATDAARSVVTYVAMNTGDSEPAIGYFRVPGPETEDEHHVDVGFAPSFVEVTGCHVDAINEVQTSMNNLLGFGWTYGTALVGTDGIPVQQVLQSAIDAEVLARRRRIETPLGTSTGELDHGSAGATRTMAPSTRVERKAQPPAEPPGEGTATEGLDTGHERQNIATLLAIDEVGRITGWDDLDLTGVSPRGFRVTVDSLDSAFRDRATDRRPMVFYKAWPAFPESEDEREQPEATDSPERTDRDDEEADADSGGNRR